MDGLAGETGAAEVSDEIEGDVVDALRRDCSSTRTVDFPVFSSMTIMFREEIMLKCATQKIDWRPRCY